MLVAKIGNGIEQVVCFGLMAETSKRWRIDSVPLPSGGIVEAEIEVTLWVPDHKVVDVRTFKRVFPRLNIALLINGKTEWLFSLAEVDEPLRL